MSVDLSVPDWLHDYVSEWCNRLNLYSWDVSICLEQVVCDEPNTKAYCDRNTSYNRARIKFSAEIEDTECWRRIVVHELVHIALARVDHYVSDALVPQVAESSQQFAGIAYTQHMESATQHVAMVLFDMVEQQNGKTKRSRKART
jgi:hypothetical protein